MAFLCFTILLCSLAPWSYTYASPVLPQPDARAAIVVEYPSGRILYQKAAHARLPEASTTKIMTAIVTIEYGNLNDVVTILPSDLVPGTSMGLHAGERQTLRNLLYGMMLPSANDAAMAIARFLGTKIQLRFPAAKRQEPVSYFLLLMNTRARQLGLKDTHFVNPHGLDAVGHYTSAYDLATLTWHARSYKVFNDVVSQPSYTVPGHQLKNINKMLGQYQGAEGVKTGYTGRAGLCLVTAATRGGRHLISVVLNAPKWTADSASLLDYGFARLAAVPTVKTAERLGIAIPPALK
jgi:D-alanyl-D-alanine carboxypeptidase (penicillin-binding protein 5/6)